MGLPTPNLFAGEHNFHSRLEWTSRQDLEQSVAVAVSWRRSGRNKPGRKIPLDSLAATNY